MYCKYYQAKVNIPYTWFITGTLRSEEHLVFERALSESKNEIMEFFVPKDSEEKFLNIMNCFLELGYIKSFMEKPNRLMPTVHIEKAP